MVRGKIVFLKYKVLLFKIIIDKTLILALNNAWFTYVEMRKSLLFICIFYLLFVEYKNQKQLYELAIMENFSILIFSHSWKYNISWAVITNFIILMVYFISFSDMERIDVRLNGRAGIYTKRIQNHFNWRLMMRKLITFTLIRLKKDWFLWQNFICTAKQQIMLAKREFWIMLLFSSTTRCNRAGAGSQWGCHFQLSNFYPKC